MKTSLDHLPEDKQYWIRRTADAIVEMAKPDMLILFGSYARGDWVEDFDEETGHYRYQSDIDLMAITKNGALANKIERKDSLERRLTREELEWLAERVNQLQTLAEKHCQAKMDSFKNY